MGESLSRLLKSKRSIIALVTLLADLAVIFGLEVPAETQQLIVTVVTSLGGMLIAGRSVSDHGEAQAWGNLAGGSPGAWVKVEPKPSDVDTENGGDEVLADD